MIEIDYRTSLDRIAPFIDGGNKRGKIKREIPFILLPYTLGEGGKISLVERLDERMGEGREYRGKVELTNAIGGPLFLLVKSKSARGEDRSIVRGSARASQIFNVIKWK